MKTIVPSKQNFVSLLLLTLFTISITFSRAQSGSGGGSGNTTQTVPDLSFTNSSLYSGTAGQDNAVYRFPSVNSNLDAFVKINGRSSSLVKLVSIDLTSTGFSKAFQPQVSYNNGSTNSAASWWMEFEISFVNKNTTTPAIVNTFNVTALDIDGDNSRLHEWDAFYNINNYTLESNSQLQVSNLMQTVSGLLQAVGKTFDGVTTQYNGIDTSITSIMTTITYNNASTFKFRTGATTTGRADVTERMYATWFKGFTYTAPVTLPVKLISFTAALNQNKAELKWSTASEINVSHFVIEKSYDGKDFSDAGLVFAYGNTSEKMNYSFSDNISNAPKSVVYYRLRSVDNDSKSQLSEVRIIRIGKQGESTKMVTYPNPFSSEIRVTLPAAWQGKAVVLEVFGQNGQRIKAINCVNASQTETILVNNLAKGFYLIKATCGYETAQEKIIKD
jgi:hypothetical protein